MFQLLENLLGDQIPLFSSVEKHLKLQKKKNRIYFCYLSFLCDSPLYIIN